jgi:hypothetical protein
MPAADKFYPQLWSFGFYGILFLVGAGLYKKPTLIKSLARYKTCLLVSSLIAYGYFYSQLPQVMSIEEMLSTQQGQSFSFSHLVLAFAEAIVGVYMTLYCLILGQKFLNQANVKFKLLADASYWMYLIHIPVLWFIQFHLLTFELNMWIKLSISIFTTLLICFASYLLLVRNTPIGWLLNGKKSLS